MRLLVLLMLLSAPVFAQDGASGATFHEDGTVRQSDGKLQAWHSASNEWVSLETFWQRYADTKGGLRWGFRSEYPPYEQVNEFDLMIIQLPQGSCLMEFFHQRWRRANDVRRWDDAFNQYAGCPYVFD